MVSARLGALHPCPHAIVSWSPWEGGMRQYFFPPKNWFQSIPILGHYRFNLYPRNIGQGSLSVYTRVLGRNQNTSIGGIGHFIGIIGDRVRPESYYN